VNIHPGALPLGQQILLDLLFPPAGAGIWWSMSSMWAMLMQGGRVSEKTKAFQKKMFWLLLVAAYSFMIGVTLYAYLT
jgi:hypothetical protein